MKDREGILNEGQGGNTQMKDREGILNEGQGGNTQ